MNQGKPIRPKCHFGGFSRWYASIMMATIVSFRALCRTLDFECFVRCDWCSDMKSKRY